MLTLLHINLDMLGFSNKNSFNFSDITSSKMPLTLEDINLSLEGKNNLIMLKLSNYLDSKNLSKSSDFKKLPKYL